VSAMQGEPGRAHLDRRSFLSLAGRAAVGLLACAAPPTPARGAPERDARPRAAAPVTLLLTGDVMLGRGVDQVLPHPGAPELREPRVASARGYVALAEQESGPIPRPASFAYVWGDALEELERAAPDLRLVNLETSVTRSDDWQRKVIHYRMSPGNVGCLTAAGIDCCVLANNHVMDFGAAGLVETLEVLEGAQLRSVGAGRNAAEAEAPAIFELPGGRRVLAIAFGSTSSGIPRGWAATADSPGVQLLEATTLPRITAAVQRVKRPGDVVVASVHWGGNWGYRVPPSQRELAHRLIDRHGVDIVHGHSSHHPKGIEVYRGRPILYGCGDLLNDYEGIRGREEYRPELRLLYFATLDSATGELVSLEMAPMRIARFQLQHAAGAEARWLSDTLDRECSALGARVEPRADARLSLAWR